MTEETQTEETQVTTITPTPAPTAVAIRNEYTFTEMQDMGRVFYESGMFKDTKTAAQALVKIKAGQELGLPAVYSMQRLYMVDGKLGMSAETMGALIKRTSKYNYRVREHTDTSCTVVFYEGGQEAYISTFTINDAKRAGLIKPGGAWQKYPRALLFSRALSQGGRIVCPDVLGGGYTLEELESIKGSTPTQTPTQAPTQREAMVNPTFVTPPIPSIPADVVAAGNAPAGDNTPEVDPDNPYGHYLETCPEHGIDWYHNKYGKRCHKNGDEWCNLAEQIKPILKARATACGFATPADLNAWLKKECDGRTWSKLSEEEQIDILYKLDQKASNPVIQAAVAEGAVLGADPQEQAIAELVDRSD